MSIAIVRAMDLVDKCTGVLLGTALGDALGLPYEGLKPSAVARRMAKKNLRHTWFAGRGIVSDDTDHAAMVARALVRSGGEIDTFERDLAQQMRYWVLACPPGIGWATLRASIRLWLGFSPKHSGVHSAGNGPAMRSALLGVYARDDASLVDLVRVSTRMTHTDPRAEDGALFVARLARQLSRGVLDPAIVPEIRDMEFRLRVCNAWEGYFLTHADGSKRMGDASGVSGFIVDTVPAVVHCTLHTTTPLHALKCAIQLGGDTDTVAAIVGALVGARDGAQAFPPALLHDIVDWPLSIKRLRTLALAFNGQAQVPSQLALFAFPRNIACTAIAFAHLSLRLIGW